MKYQVSVRGSRGDSMYAVGARRIIFDRNMKHYLRDSCMSPSCQTEVRPRYASILDRGFPRRRMLATTAVLRLQGLGDRCMRHLHRGVPSSDL